MNIFSRERLFEIAGRFMLDGEILDIAPYGSGHINDTFRMTVGNQGTEKDYILQRMNGDIFKNREELMENIVRVTSFLKEKIVAQGGNPDRETLQIIPTREGEDYYKEEAAAADNKICEVVVAKNRPGGLDTVKLGWIPDCTKFRTIMDDGSLVPRP